MAAAVTPPLTLGEILDRTIQLYRRNFLLFVGVSLAPSACYVLIYGSVSLYLTSHAGQLQGAPNLQLMLTFFGVIAGFLLIGMPLLVSISALSLSALNFAASQRNSQQPVTIRAAYAYALKRFWRYLGILSLQLLFALVIPGAVFAGVIVIGSISAAFLSAAGGNQTVAVFAALVLFVLFIGFFVAMVLIWLRFSLAFPACLVEDLRIWPAMQRSNILSKGSRGRIFVMYLLVAILVAVAYYALILPVDAAIALIFFKSNQMLNLLSKPPLVLQVVNLFISFLQRAFALPVYSIALLLFYNDQRTRQEGYDIELLMAQAGWSTLPPAPAHAALDAGYAAEPARPADPAARWALTATPEPSSFNALPSEAFTSERQDSSAASSLSFESSETQVSENASHPSPGDSPEPPTEATRT